MSKKPAHKYRVAIEVDITYLSNDVHDQGLYHMLAEILQTAQMEYRKYRFSIADLKLLEQPKDASPDIEGKG